MLSILVIVVLFLAGYLLGTKVVLVVLLATLIYSWYAKWEIEIEGWHKQKGQWFFHTLQDD